MTLFIAQLHFILYNWRWMMFHPKHVWLNNMNFKNIVWFIKAISYFVLLRSLGIIIIIIIIITLEWQVNTNEKREVHKDV